MIHYTVAFEQAEAHLFDVKLNLNFALQQGQEFYLPAWIPGSYMIRDFARNIVELSANCKGENISLAKKDKSTWYLSQDVDCLEIRYQVYAWDLSVRSAHLDNCHAFFNGTSLFLGVTGFEAEKHHVIVKHSTADFAREWQVATAMTPLDIDDKGFGKYISDDYEEVIDHPFEIARLDKVEFDVFGVPHTMVFTEAPAQVDWDRIAKDVKAICETEVKFFGDEKPPFDRYVFMTFVQKKGFGGLEHRASTALHCSFQDLPLLGVNQPQPDKHYRTFLSLCCHEYFHNWNVKRIKPARFIPMDLSQEIHTELLWFFEGITSYYDELLMVRAGVVSVETYLDMLAQTLTRTARSQGRHIQSITESSFDAWTKFYKQDENAINAIVSYYGKGAMVALCLDWEIRKITHGQKSLDDLMRLVWNQHGKQGKGIGETQIQQSCKELVGESMNEFFHKALYSTDDLPLDPLFQEVGLVYQVLPQYLQVEKGGFVSRAKQRNPVAYLGIGHKASELGAQVTNVVNGLSGSKAGLSQGDLIIAIDYIRVASSELDACVASKGVGTEVTITYFRRDRLHQTRCSLQPATENTVFLSYNDGKASKKLLEWLGRDESTATER